MAGLACNQAIGQLAGAVLARSVPGPRLYGELSLLLQYLNLAALGLGLGLDSAVVYDIATGRPEAGRTFAAAARGMVLGAAAPALLAFLAAPLVGRAFGVPGFATAVAIGSASLFAQAAVNAAVAVESGLRRFASQMGLLVAATALGGAGRIAALGWAARGGAALGLVALVGGAGVALVGAAGLLLGGRLLGPGAPGDGRPWIRDVPRMLRYGWPLWAGNLLKAFQQPYLALLAGGIGATAAGLVSNDVTLLGWPFLVTWAFRLVAVPLVAAGRTPQQRRARIGTCFRQNHLALFPVVALLCLWARPVVVAVYGARYAGAAGLLPLLALGVYGSSVGRLATDALAAVDRTRESVPIMVISSAPLLLLGPLAAGRGLPVLGALYCLGWLASAAYAWRLLRRHRLCPDLRAAVLEPLLPTVCALPLALWAGHGGGPVALAAALVVLAGLSAAVYRGEAPGLGEPGPVPAPRGLPAPGAGTAAR